MIIMREIMNAKQTQVHPCNPSQGVADLDEAPAWGRKAAVACRAPVEVRAFGIPA